MTERRVLLDRAFMAALVDADLPDHTTASDRYRTLLDAYEAGLVRLLARHDHLAELDPELRRTLLAPVAPVAVARQHRRQAARLRLGDEAEDGPIDDDVAVTLVVLRRERIHELITPTAG